MRTGRRFARATQRPSASGSSRPRPRNPSGRPGSEEDDGLVFGNEAAAAPAWLHDELGDRRLTIPHANPDLRSLNLSTAAGIATFEALRQLGGR